MKTRGSKSVLSLFQPCWIGDRVRKLEVGDQRAIRSSPQRRPSRLCRGDVIPMEQARGAYQQPWVEGIDQFADGLGERILEGTPHRAVFVTAACHLPIVAIEESKGVLLRPEDLQCSCILRSTSRGSRVARWKSRRCIPLMRGDTEARAT